MTARTTRKAYGRPVVNLEVAQLTCYLGIDYLNTTAMADDDDSEADQLGFGGSVTAEISSATIALSYGHGTQEGKNTAGSDLDDETTNSIGGLCDLSFGKDVLTLAVYYTACDQDNNSNDKTQIQYVAAYAHPLHVEGATIKFATSYASATEDNAAGDIDSDALGFKVRLNYDF